MEENLNYVILGAFAAVLVILVLHLLVEFWLHSVLPLWRRWRYRGVHIAGGWKGLANDAAPRSGQWSEVGLTLEQHLRELRGLLWIRHCGAERSSELRLPVAGSISGGYVTLNMAPGGKATPLVATALLKIDGRGSSLNGQLLYREAATDTVTGINLSVHRAESMALPRLRPMASGGLSELLAAEGAGAAS